MLAPVIPLPITTTSAVAGKSLVDRWSRSNGEGSECQKDLLEFGVGSPAGCPSLGRSGIVRAMVEIGSEGVTGAQCRCRRGHVVLFAISAEGEEELLDHALIGQPFVHVERLADCPIGCTSLILAARCSVYVACSSTPRASLLRREWHLGLPRDSHMPMFGCFNMGRTFLGRDLSPHMQEAK